MPFYLADLHTHSTASDGQYTPSELVGLAQARGLEVMALTDHDTLDGLDQAIEAGAALGMRVLRGVELGAKEDRNLHILGYGFSPTAPGLHTLCAQLRAGRDQRKYRIAAFLKEKGVPVSLDEVEALAGGGVIARPHFAQAMVRRGYVASTREAFDRYLDTDEYQRIERLKASAADCIAAIRETGGHAVLAHPHQLKLPEDRLEALVARLTEDGLEGLECHYPRHSPAQVKQYLALARKYHLYVTAGSDFHGESVRPDTMLSPVGLEVDWLG